MTYARPIYSAKEIEALAAITKAAWEAVLSPPLVQLDIFDALA